MISGKEVLSLGEGEVVQDSEGYYYIITVDNYLVRLNDGIVFEEEEVVSKIFQEAKNLYQ